MAVVKDKIDVITEDIEKATAAGDQAKIGDLEAAMAAEKDRRANWKLENERRRHNFVPLIFELLKNFA